MGFTCASQPQNAQHHYWRLTAFCNDLAALSTSQWLNKNNKREGWLITQVSSWRLCFIFIVLILLYDSTQILDHRKMLSVQTRAYWAGLNNFKCTCTTHTLLSALALAGMLTLCHMLALVSSQSYHVHSQSRCPIIAIKILHITILMFLLFKKTKQKRKTDCAICHLQALNIFRYDNWKKKNQVILDNSQQRKANINRSIQINNWGWHREQVSKYICVFVTHPVACVLH